MERRRFETIVGLAGPIVGALASQNVFNLVDTAMVGALGPVPLAAVGVANFANFMAVALVIGLSSGVQAMAARRKGEERWSEMAVPLNGGLLLALALAIPLTVGLTLLTPAFFPHLNGDPAVVTAGVPYLEMRLLAVAAVGMNFAFRGYWNGVSLPRIYLRTLVTMHVINVVLNYALIFGKLGFPALGTLGAAIGTTTALYVGTLLYAVQALAMARQSGFLHGLPDRETVRTMLRLSIPSSIQQLFFATGFTVLFWIIGRVGTAEVAAANVLINLILVALLPGMGLGLAATSLVSQALGRNEAKDAARWGWDVTKVATVVMAALGLPLLLFPSLILKGFLHDPETLALARLPLILVGLTVWIDAAGLVLMNALLGAGAARQVLVVSLTTQWLLFLPLAWIVGPELGYGLLGIWAAFIGYRVLHAAVLSLLWQGGRWATIRV